MEKIAVTEMIEKYLGEGKKITDWLNSHPEVSGKEKYSCQYLVELLKSYGYQVESPLKRVKYSFRAVHKNSFDKKRPKVALLCEYDAMEEIGHGCGHSVSCAASIICALALEELYPDFPFQLDLIGTPNEEVNGGKIVLLQKGIFSEYEFAIIAHMSPTNQPYFRTLASNDLMVNFYGKTAHASVDPWNAINALNGVQLFFHATDMMRQHLGPGDQIQGVILDGGKIPNIIPEKATGYIYLRAYTIEKLNLLVERVQNCAKGAAIATENTFTTAQLYPSYAELFIGENAKNIVCSIMNELHLDWEEQKAPSGSSDIGNVDMVIPVFHPMISIGNHNVSLYSREFAEEIRGEGGRIGLENGAKVIAKIIEKLAFDQEALKKLQEEHAIHRHL